MSGSVPSRLSAGTLRAMKHAVFGTFPIVYPPAAAYFDCEGACLLKDERCDGLVKVHAYFYMEAEPPFDADGLPVAQPLPTTVELMLADGVDYIELCSIHHGEWWQMQREEYRARAAALSASDDGGD